MINASVLGQFADDLTRLAERLRGTQAEDGLCLVLTFAQVRAGYPTHALSGLESWLKTAPAGAYYLYQFSIDPSVDMQALHQAFKRTKSLKTGNRYYARQQAPSPVLYVGGTSSLMARLKGHLGYGTKRRYAMHLNQWLPDLNEQLQIQIWRLAPSTEKAVRQTIEDSLWARQKPMLGRQGAL